MTVNQYRIAWTQYLQYRLFDGTVYSDRYFMQQFIRQLHPSINQRIGSHILRAHFDGGSMATTTDQLHCLWHYRAFLIEVSRENLSGGHSKIITSLFKIIGFKIESTAPDSSHQNRPSEGPHWTIAVTIQTMLASIALPKNFGPTLSTIFCTCIMCDCPQ
jgi:hypothetical protein